MDDVKNIANGLFQIQERIAKALDSADLEHDVSLVAVSKFHNINAIEQAALCGQVLFGESYVQEALEKQEQWKKKSLPLIKWHFIGHIQSRKAKDVVGRFDLIHSVDSQKIAHLLNAKAKEKNICQAVLIQVNIGAEEQKSGVSLDQLSDLTKYILQCKHLNLQGLMCLPPVFDAGLAARPYFALLRNLRNELEQEFSCNLPHLSMGMSGDLEAAIFEGATLVRVGTDIFGNRSQIDEKR